LSTSIFFKYPPQSDFEGRRVLNIGCGFSKYEVDNVTNLDASASCKPDVIWDLNETPLPFEDNTFDLVIANHILEHLPRWWECFSELSRVTKVDGVVEVWVPGSGSDSIHGFRDHVNEINQCSFFGVYGTYREGGNAWAIDNAEGMANRLKNFNRVSKFEKSSFMSYLPEQMQMWMARHLRNIIVEDGYFFRKVTQEEYEKEAKVFHARVRASSIVSVPRVREAAISGRV